MESYDKKIREVIEENRDLFPTDAKFWSWLRGSLRRGMWEKSPLKFKLKNKGMGSPPKSYTGRGRKGQVCALSGVWTPTSKMEVDHKEGNMPLSSVEDILPFLMHMVVRERDVQVVCKEAHKTKSYADKYGVSYEKAALIKQAIEICKLPAEKQKAWLESKGIVPAATAPKRRTQVESYLTKGEK